MNKVKIILSSKS